MANKEIIIALWHAGRMYVIPAGRHHAAFNVRPTVSLHVTHVTGLEELADGVIVTALEYRDIHESPRQLGLHDLLECRVELLLALPTAALFDNDSSLSLL